VLAKMRQGESSDSLLHNVAVISECIKQDLR
jgi:hypothetical protein